VKNFCPHCCNNSKQFLIVEQPFEGKGWGVEDGEEMETEESYYVYKCEICNQILVYHQFFDHSLKLLFPNIELHDSVPLQVTKIYREAVRIKAIAPNAYAVQIRRALERICKDRGAANGSLAAQLKELGARGEIPSTLSEASDILRIIGNIGAHAGDEEVHPLQVLAIEDFFLALVEYIYVSPAKIAEFKSSLKKFELKT
jgi:hypothetical protein